MDFTDAEIAAIFDLPAAECLEDLLAGPRLLHALGVLGEETVRRLLFPAGST